MEAVQQSVVFVNDVRLRCKLLNDGCKLTIGGARKSYLEGSRIPANPGPHLVYEYKVVKDVNPVGIYQQPSFLSTELVTLEDYVSGRIVKETYHMEDFNETVVTSF